MNKILAIIPARGKSKGIKNKNLAQLCNNKLIDYSIEVAKKSSCFEDIIVTSDSDQILDHSCSIFEKIEAIKRPDHLAKDTSTTYEAVEHALKMYHLSHDSVNAICVLQPTSPIRLAQHLKDACDIFFKSSKDSLISVSSPMQHPTDCIYEDQHDIKYCFGRDEKSEIRRQDFKKTWFINGSIYITDLRFFYEQKEFYSLSNCELFEMDEEYSIDIDNEFDLKVAEHVLSNIVNLEEVI